MLCRVIKKKKEAGGRRQEAGEDHRSSSDDGGRTENITKDKEGDIIFMMKFGVMDTLLKEF